jgi:hypothetical protein
MRVLNRLAAAVLGLALLAFGLLVAVEAILFGAGRPAWLLPLNRWYAGLTTTTYADPLVRDVAIVLAVVGLLILLLQLRPWPPDQLVVGGDGVARWRVRRRSVERQVAREVDRLTSVVGATASVRGRPDLWRVRVHALARPEQRDEVRQAARAALDRLAAPAEVGLRVDLRPPRRVA